jgi:dipeptidyl aminopeptidase/acylaminoacyl peptidase
MGFTHRTRFHKDIVAEFLPPARPSSRVVIYCGGMPSVPAKKHLLEFLAKKGYWVFFPRYRGTWESSGKFLRVSLERDILDVIDELPKGFTSFFDEKRYRVKPSRLYVFGSSFGGPAALLASRDRRVTKAVAFSPVVDWRDQIKHGETNSWTERFTRAAFGEAYRFSRKDWQKLDAGKFYNPAAHARAIDGKKIMIVHAKDDKVVRQKPVVKFARQIRAKLLLLPRGGHMGSSVLLKPQFYKKIAKFLRGA